MGTPLRILLIDDDPDDRSLVQRTLRPEFPDLIVTEISESEDLARALDGAMPDLVITDYQLHWTDGLAVLRAVKDRWPDAPVLMVTGTGSELIAVEAMKAGLDDYVLKAPHHLTRLPAAARAALEQAAQRGTLRENEERYRSIFENSIDAILLTAPDGRILAANREACHIFGRTEEEIYQIGRGGLVDTADPRLPALLEERARTGKAKGELTFLRKDGTKFPGEISSAVFTDREGLSRTSMIIRDITEHKRAEEAFRASQQLFERTFAAFRDAAFIIDADTVEILECNPAAPEIFGYSREEMLGRTTTFLHIDEAGLEEFRLHLYPAIEARGFLGHFEFRMKRKDGTVFPSEHSVMPLNNEEGRRIGWVSVVRDITERKRAEEALRKSEERFSKAFHANPALLTITRLDDGRLIDVNDSFLRMAGYTREEIIDRTSLELGVWANPDERQTILQMLTDHKAVRNLERKFRTKLGDICDLVASLELIEIDGEPHMLGLTEDITERKRAEEEIQKFRTIADKAGYGIAISDLEGNLFYLNECFAQMHGYTAEKLIGRNLSVFHNEEQMENVDRLKKQLREEGSYVAEEVWHTRKDGTVFPALMHGTAIRDAKGNPLFMAATAIDITERKRAEEALRESEADYRALAEAARDFIFVINREGIIEYSNTFAAARFGLQPSQIVGKRHADLFPPTVLEKQVRSVRTVFETLQPLYEETLTLFPDGEIWLGTWLVPLKDEAGTARAVMGISRDITERQRAEEELRRSRDELRDLSARLAEVEEMERQRLARELHDQVGQNLTALNLNLNILRSQVPADVAGKWSTRLADSMRLVEETVAHIRGVMAELRPPVLDDYGLTSALRWYSEQFSTRTGLAVSVQGEELTPRLPQAVETALFRIAQEALTNVAKHAQATRVGVRLEADEDLVRLTITDDGVGFDPAAARPSGEGGKWGLITMRERAEAVRARFSVASLPGEGTTIVVEVPR